MFLSDLNTHRDPSKTYLAMVSCALRSVEVRSVRLADVDIGMRRVRVVRKDDRQRLVAIDRA